MLLIGCKISPFEAISEFGNNQVYGRVQFLGHSGQWVAMLEEPVGDRMAEESFCFIVITIKGRMRGRLFSFMTLLLPTSLRRHPRICRFTQGSSFSTAKLTRTWTDWSSRFSLLRT